MKRCQLTFSFFSWKKRFGCCVKKTGFIGRKETRWRSKHAMPYFTESLFWKRRYLIFPEYPEVRTLQTNMCLKSDQCCAVLLQEWSFSDSSQPVSRKSSKVDGMQTSTGRSSHKNNNSDRSIDSCRLASISGAVSHTVEKHSEQQPNSGVSDASINSDGSSATAKYW